MVMTSTGIPGEIKVFLNHIYEYKKGVRNMVLCTLNKCYEPIAVERLENQKICFIKQEASDRCVNLYFGKSECIETILGYDKSETQKWSIENRNKPRSGRELLVNI